jgi:hypothetical protein
MLKTLLIINYDFRGVILTHNGGLIQLLLRLSVVFSFHGSVLDLQHNHAFMVILRIPNIIIGMIWKS